jgi:AcrR family transcriptional regulator
MTLYSFLFLTSWVGKSKIIKNDMCVIFIGKSFVKKVNSMPKVNQEYVSKKKEAILEAALVLCQSKPLYEITMKDIIKQSGLSQGGIYLYFSDLDELLIALINRLNTGSDYKTAVDQIITGSTSPAAAIEALFTFLGEYISENETTLGKIQFELTVLLTNHPERQEKMLGKITDSGSAQYLMGELMRLISEGIASGVFKPVVPPEEIFVFMMTSIDGIVRDVILQRCYGLMPEVPIRAPGLMQTLSKSVLLLLDGDRI